MKGTPVTLTSEGIMDTSDLLSGWVRLATGVKVPLHDRRRLGRGHRVPARWPERLLGAGWGRSSGGWAAAAPTASTATRSWSPAPAPDRARAAARRRGLPVDARQHAALGTATARAADQPLPGAHGGRPPGVRPPSPGPSTSTADARGPARFRLNAGQSPPYVRNKEVLPNGPVATLLPPLVAAALQAWEDGQPLDSMRC